MKQCWFYLEPYVFTYIQENVSIFYNTLDGNLLKYDDECITDIVVRINDISNIGVVAIDIDDPIISSFIIDVRKFYMGDILFKDDNKISPKQLMPFLKVDTLANNQRKMVDNVLENIAEITYFADSFYTKTYYQFGDFHFFEDYTQQYFDENFKFSIGEFFATIAPLNESLIKINIVLGDCADSSIIEFLESLPERVKLKCYVVVSLDNYLILRHNFSLQDLPHIEVLVDDFRAKDIKSYLSPNVNFYILVKDEDDLDYLTKYSLLEFVKLVPSYLTSNISFLERYVYSSIDDFKDLPIKMRHILQNRVINSVAFGKLLISNMADVKTNWNIPIVGNLKKKSLIDIVDVILKDENQFWFMTRDKVYPCSRCVFKYLCAPISNLEVLMNKYNLCNINNE